MPSIHPASKAILLNKGVLAINDDPLGRMPFRYSIDSLTGIELWRAHEKHEEEAFFGLSSCAKRSFVKTSLGQTRAKLAAQ